MAATNYHNEGTTDMTQAASWRTRTFGGGAVPINSGIVYFAGGSDRIVGDATSLNPSSGLTYIAFTGGWSGTLGSNGTSATISVGTGTGVTAGNMLDFAAGGGVAYVTIGSKGIGQVNVKGAGKLYLTGGTVGTGIAVSSGELDLNSSVTATGKTIDIYGGSVVIDYKGSDAPVVNMYGGSLLMRRALKLNAYGGHATVQVEKAQNGIVASGYLHLLGDSAVVDWRCGDIPATSLLDLRKGTFILKNAVTPCSFVSAVTTIGDTVIDLPSVGGSKITWNSTRTLVGAATAVMRGPSDLS